MKITGLTVQQRDKNRVNVHVDGKYRFSLDVFQIAELSIRVGREYTDVELEEIEDESRFGKLYARTLEYCLMRPHSAREVRDYLYKKTLSRRYKAKTGEIKQKPGVTPLMTGRVFDRLVDKGYIDDRKFAHFWVENRHQRKGSSFKKLKAELASKGVDAEIIANALSQTDRSDAEEIEKILAKKRSKYGDDHRLMHYLARQGFSYDDIKAALEKEETQEDY
jgi:regulatory protein